MKKKDEELSPAGKRWRKFLAHKRGAWALRILVFIYAVSLCSELICNSDPLLLICRGYVFFPAFRTYTQNAVLGNGIDAIMTDYRDSAELKAAGGRAIYAPFRHGPQDTMRESDFDEYRRVSIRIRPVQSVMRIDLDSSGRIVRSEGDTEHFFPGKHSANDIKGTLMASSWNVPASMLGKTVDAPVLETVESANGSGIKAVARRAPGFESDATGTVRIVLRSPAAPEGYAGSAARTEINALVSKWTRLNAEDRTKTAEAAIGSFSEYIPVFNVRLDGANAEVRIAAEDVAWPFRPVPGSWCGTDMSGRDVLARLLYGTRIAMTFGLLLVFVSSVIGIAAGAVQGYFAGWTDLAGQRLTEIWSALPFLYIMILLGNTIGRGFMLFLLCYAAFNWIGVSSYIRAEFLRLRVRAFVDAARTQGLGHVRIMVKHILPNALSPLITLLPFMLVGAVGSLAALDYLGFGLPDGTPSWGALLFQAQLARHAWWLILYPSAALFAVMILGVFIGEGMREAFDPREYSKTE